VAQYDKKYESTVRESQRAMATRAAKARQMFADIVRGSHPGGNGLGSDQWKNETVEDVFIDDVKNVKPFVPRSELETRLRSATPVKYDFIQSDETCLKHNGQCVLGQIDKIYGRLRSDLARARFIEACSEH